MVDAADSKSAGLRAMGVRFPPSAPKIILDFFNFLLRFLTVPPYLEMVVKELNSIFV